MKQAMEAIVEAGPKGFRAVRPAGWCGCCPGNDSIGAWEFFVHQAARNLQEGRLENEIRRWFRENPDVFGKFVAWDIETAERDMARDMGMPGFSEADRLIPVEIPTRWELCKRWMGDVRFWFSVGRGQGWTFLKSEWRSFRKVLARRVRAAWDCTAEWVSCAVTDLVLLPQRISEDRKARLEAQAEQEKAIWQAQHGGFDTEGRAA